MKALILLFPVFLALAGCANIRSKQPVGKEPVDLSASIGEVELSDLAGEWVNVDGEASSLTVTNAREGEVLYTSLEDEDEEPAKFQLRMTGDHVFVNFEANEDGERTWLLMKVNGELNQILLWEPDTEAFRKLIAEGRIKGTNDPEKVMNEEGEEVEAKNPGAVIDDPDGEWVGKMVAGEFGVVFDWMEPRVLRRRVGEEDSDAEEGEASAETTDPDEEGGCPRPPGSGDAVESPPPNDEGVVAPR